MTVKNKTEWLDKTYDKYCEITGKSNKELQNPDNGMKASESRLDMRNRIAKSKAGYRHYYSGFKKGQSYVILMDKDFEKYAYKLYSKLKINN
jgi:hypothetical protein